MKHNHESGCRAAGFLQLRYEHTRIDWRRIWRSVAGGLNRLADRTRRRDHHHAAPDSRSRSRYPLRDWRRPGVGNRDVLRRGFRVRKGRVLEHPARHVYGGGDHHRRSDRGVAGVAGLHRRHRGSFRGRSPLFGRGFALAAREISGSRECRCCCDEPRVGFRLSNREWDRQLPRPPHSRGDQRDARRWNVIWSPRDRIGRIQSNRLRQGL